MLWFYLTLAAVLIWSIGNIIDKYVMKKYIRRSELPTFFTAAMGLIAAVILLFTHALIIPSLDLVLLLLLAGILNIAATLYYFKSLFREEVSRVVPLFAFGPVFVLLLSIIVLQEFLSGVQYLGIALIIIGSIAVTMKKGATFSFSKVLFLMIISALLYAVHLVILKYTLETMSFWDTFFWKMIGGGLAIPFLLFYLYTPLKGLMKTRGGIYITINEGANIVATLLTIAALSIGFASLVSTMGQLQPAIVFLIVVGLGLLRPSLLKEGMKRYTIGIKMLAILITVAGAILLV